MSAEPHPGPAQRQPFWLIDWRIMPRWVRWVTGFAMPACGLVIVIGWLPLFDDRTSERARSLAADAIIAMLILQYVVHYRAQRRAGAAHRAPGE